MPTARRGAIAVVHQKLIKHMHEPGHAHEFTFSCYQRRPLLTNDDWRTRFSRHIDKACKQFRFDLVTFVYMPEHVHLLTFPHDEKPQFGPFLARIKQPFSAEINGILVANNAGLVEQLTVQERPGKYCFRYWQEGAGYDRNVFSREVLLAAIDYIHENPVRRGLCRRAIDWKWSSARYYLLQPERQQFAGLPFVHGIPADVLN
ncbi:MAG: REP-associated tyrosine transposase [Planctomycetaceae bacterium]